MSLSVVEPNSFVEKGRQSEWWGGGGRVNGGGRVKIL